jgi:hypothetical protein
MSTAVCARRCGKAHRAIDWMQDTTAMIVRKIRAADSAPGVLGTLLGKNCFFYGAHGEERLQGPPGQVLARRDGAICIGTVDGAIWINFFGPDPAYHEARRRFVFKGNPSPERSRAPIRAAVEATNKCLEEGKLGRKRVREDTPCQIDAPKSSGVVRGNKWKITDYTDFIDRCANWTRLPVTIRRRAAAANRAAASKVTILLNGNKKATSHTTLL